MEQASEIKKTRLTLKVCLLFLKTTAFKPNTGSYYTVWLKGCNLNIFELGTSLGISTAYMALAAPDASITTIEGCKGIAEKAAENFAKLKITNIKQEIGSFDTLLETTLNNIPQIDFLPLLMGTTGKNQQSVILKAVLKKSHNDTVLIFDDIHWSADMNEAWNIICSHKSVTLTLDLFQFGIVFFKKELSKQDFIISY